MQHANTATNGQANSQPASKDQSSRTPAHTTGSTLWRAGSTAAPLATAPVLFRSQ